METSDEEFSVEKLLNVASVSTIKLIKPISICMIMVITIYLEFILIEKKTNFSNYYNIESDEITEKNFTQFLIGAALFIFFLVISTLILLLLFKYKLYGILFAWILVSTVILFMFFTSYLVQIILIQLNLCLDFFTVYFLLFNNAVLAVLSVLCSNKMPKILNQIYLVLTAVKVSLQILIVFPKLNCWILLFFMIIWDSIAVLASNGPLKLIINVASKRKQRFLPAILYSTFLIMTKLDENQENLFSQNEKKQSLSFETSSIQINQETYTEFKSDKKIYLTRESFNLFRNIKLGLGDFIFYSVLAAKSAQLKHWFIVLCCLITIIVGLIVTLFILSITRKPLPALPLPILFSFIIYFLAYFYLIDFEKLLYTNKLFI